MQGRADIAIFGEKFEYSLELTNLYNIKEIIE